MSSSCKTDGTLFGYIYILFGEADRSGATWGLVWTCHKILTIPISYLMKLTIFKCLKFQMVISYVTSIKTQALLIQLKKPLSQISNALERSRRTIAVVSCRSALAHEILRWIAAREVEWFSKNQIDNSRVCHIFEKTLLTDCT